MGFRFRKSINAGPFRLNLSKTGFGCSFGAPGFRQTWLANGRSRTTYSLPGTGLSYVDESKASNKRNYKHSEFAQKKNFNIFSFLLIAYIFSFLFSPKHVFSTFFTILILVAIFFIIKKLIYVNSKEYKQIELYDEAITFMANEDYITAIEKFKLCKDMDVGEINNAIYQCYVQMKEYNLALEFVQNNSLDGDKRDKILFLYSQMNDPKKALEYSQKMYSDSTRNTIEHLTFEAKCYIELKQYDLALETLLRGPYRKRNMNKAMCYYRYCLGECYEKMNEFDKALKQYNKIVAYNQNFEDVNEKIQSLRKGK